MDRTGRYLFTLGAALSALLALLHLGIVVVGLPAYAYFGPEDLLRLAEDGSVLPVISTLVIAVTLLSFALFAASGAGHVRRLLLLNHGVDYPTRHVVFSAVSLFVGLVHLIGCGLRWRFLLKTSS